MKKSNLFLSVCGALLLHLFLIGCHDPKADLETFVKNYNSITSSRMFENSNILNSRAAVRGKDGIWLTLQVDAPNNDFHKQYYKNLLAYLALDMTDDKETKMLIDRGIVFQLTIAGTDKSVIGKYKLDKKNIPGLIAKLDQKNIEIPVNPNGVIPGNRVITSELRASVNKIRRGLPIRSEKDKSTVTDIDINQDLELEYHIKVDEPFASQVANPAAMDYMKQMVIRNTDLAQLYQSIGVHGVRTLHFKYFNPNYEMIGSFLVSYEELYTRKENNYADPQ